MQSRTTRIAVTTAAYIVFLCLLEGQSSAQEPPALEQIIEGLERAEKMFFESESLFIHYRLIDSQDVVPSSYSGKFELAEFTLAYKGNKWLNERRFTHPTKSKGYILPAAPRTQIMKEHFLVEWNQEFQSAGIDAFNEGRNLFQGLLYTRNLSLDAPKYIAKVGGVDIAVLRKKKWHNDDYIGHPFLPEFLRDNMLHYKVLPTPEKVNDVLCWVVEWPGMDKFWVDPKRGFAIPRRIYCWDPRKSRRLEFQNHDYREVKSGLWLPFAQTEYRYADIRAEKEAVWGKVTARNEYQVSSIEFDQVADSVFEINLPPGTRVIDNVRDFQYTTSGKDDTDPFNAAITEAMLQRKPSRKLSRNRILVMVALGLLLFLMVVYGVRRWLLRAYPNNP